MRLFIWAAAILFVSFLSFQLVRLYSRNSELDAKATVLGNEIQLLDQENKTLQADAQYLAEPENLAKELKSKFDYKRPGEKLIKIQ